MNAMPVYMDAELAPSRSLSPRGFFIVMAIMATCCGFMGLYFLSLGFLPIVGFLGLDVLALWYCFKLCFRDQKQRTFIRVTSRSIDLRYVDGRGRETTASLPSSFARVEIDCNGPHPGQAIRIAASGKAYLIGKFLTLDERQDFVKSLRSALHDAKSERYAAE